MITIKVIFYAAVIIVHILSSTFSIHSYKDDIMYVYLRIGVPAEG